MVYSPSPSPPPLGRTSLTQLMSRPGPSRPRRPDTIPNSCSEDSESDNEPLPIPASSKNNKARVPSWVTNGVRDDSRPGSSRNNSNAIHAQPPQTHTPQQQHSSATRVTAALGSNGRIVYQANTGPKEAFYYVVQWRKPQQKKHKTWDGDAYLRVEGQKIIMVDEEGKHMGSGGLAGQGLPQVGQEFRIGCYDTEIDREITFDEYRSMTSALGKNVSIVPSYMTPTLNRARTTFKPPTQVSKPKESIYIPTRDENQPPPGSTSLSAPTTFKKIDAESFYSKAKPKADKIVIGEKSSADRKRWGGAAHDPDEKGAIVMTRPPDAWARARRTEICDVVVSPSLGKCLRAHQVAGVKFMYDCVMGLTKSESSGCILADEMGLGKTLQTITLIYTLLKQSPFADVANGVIGRAMIVVPVTLVENWRKEFMKWTKNQIRVVVADGKESTITNFVNNKHQQVLIIGYERLRKDVKLLKSCVPPIDLIVCDEGHRLKSKDNKTTKMFDELKTQRRIILSGTPVQNDLGEYWAMANFVCPGVLGRYSAFARQFEKPILKARTPGCNKLDEEAGQARAEELNDVSKTFVLRRTAAVLDNYLPPKHEYVLFVAPSPLQLAILGRLLDPTVVSSFLRNRSNPLGFIDAMRKVCNSPTLLKRKAEKDETVYDDDDTGAALRGALQALPADYKSQDPSESGKLSLLVRMLKHFHDHTDEKVVVVSNWTSTLDVIKEHLDKLRYPSLRLDGSTPQKARQALVDQFNRSPRSNSYVFLLSAKAGGTGLNLIGASRLILFDSDWNPSTDLQAMARIHRDGQKKPVFIYRLLTTNTIDEKIYQRQVTKTGLSDQMMDGSSGNGGGKSSNSFTDAELRDLFRVDLTTDGCQTHDLLGCDCITNPSEYLKRRIGALKSSSPSPDTDSDGGLNTAKFVSATNYNPNPPPKLQKKMDKDKEAKLAALRKWNHMDAFDPGSFNGLSDDALHYLLDQDKESSATSASLNGGSNTGLGEFDDVNVADDSGFHEVDLNQRNETCSSGSATARKRARATAHVANDDDFAGIEKIDDDVKTQDASDKLYDVTSSSGNVNRDRVEKRKKRKTKRLFDLEDMGKKYNLKDIADSGGGGRVMFIFEKTVGAKPRSERMSPSME